MCVWGRETLYRCLFMIKRPRSRTPDRSDALIPKTGIPRSMCLCLPACLPPARTIRHPDCLLAAASAFATATGLAAPPHILSDPVARGLVPRHDRTVQYNEEQ